MRVSSSAAALGTALLIVLFHNTAFWRAVYHALEGTPGLGCIMLSIFVVLTLSFAFCLSLFNWRRTFKPVAILLLVGASIASYFMNTYGVLIDKGMIRNVMETDFAEAWELGSFELVSHVFFLGILPAALLQRLDIQYRPLREELRLRFLLSVACLVIVSTLLAVSSKDFISLTRNHRSLRFLINPANYLYSISSQTCAALRDSSVQLKPIGIDARLARTVAERGKKTVLILVVGEAARAANFSLNGYARNTNPRLRAEDIVTFSQFYSCGTSTAVSLPCMFSSFDRRSFDKRKGKEYENLLDVLARAKVDVLWRENNSGCKGVCARVATQTTADINPEACASGSCHDETMLQNLEAFLDKSAEDSFIVLHQEGSHGPAYYLRYPSKFEQFTPSCKTSALQKCKQEEILNGYDNTILYTDYFLEQVLSLLKRKELQYNTALIYVSDHGESLGERGLYLHGLPYLFAPDEQKHIPFLVWLSSGFEKTSGISEQCLRARSTKRSSHANLFHSVLGLLEVRTAGYKPALDLFSKCRQKV